MMFVEIYVDGVSVGNLGLFGIGIFIKYDGKIEFFLILIGDYLNQEVEFFVLIEGMKLCVVCGYELVLFWMDLDIVEWVVDLEVVKNKIFQLFVDEII